MVHEDNKGGMKKDELGMAVAEQSRPTVDQKKRRQAIAVLFLGKGLSGCKYAGFEYHTQGKRSV